MSQRFIAGNIESGDTADPESMQREARNVVLFGESGVGKSSIINTIVGRAVAETHNLVQGCTRQCAPHTVALDSRTEIKLWDTVGLDEGTDGSIPLFQARQMLKEFLQRQHSTSGGIDLLLCCVRAGRMKTADFERYKFVYEEVCRKTIPVAIVVTGLENYQPEGDMDWWWSVNERELLKLGFQFCAHACVTSLPRESFGIGDVHRVDLSEQRLRDLLRREFRAPRNVIVFGESRTDRTALIDMITGHNTERRHGQGTENAFLFECDRVTLPQNEHLNLWSVAGVDDSVDVASAALAEKNLKLFLQKINQTAGIDLLVFCMRAGRAKLTHIQNYNIFYAAVCRKKVPVVLVTLGLPTDENTWWRDNEKGLKKKGLRFEKHVYVPCSSSGQLFHGNGATRVQLINVLEEEYISGTWKIGDDVFGMAAPDVRAVVGELWTREHRPSPTIAICDMTKKETLLEIAPGVQPSWRSASGFINELEYRFQHVDPHSLSHTAPSETQSRVLEHGGKGICLLMFFMPANETEEIWRTLCQFYSTYRGDVIPLIIVIQGLTKKRFAENAWKDAPRNIRRQISAYLTYHPGPGAAPQALATAQQVLLDMIEDRCLVGFGEKAVVLQGILSYWKKYRSGRARDSGN